uniref:THAP domain-containing protein 1 n=1 Tax=Dicentrarchus labrax TaxID=13489 RepID=A0A8P4KRR2_DICLA
MAHCYCSVAGCSNNKKNFPHLSFHDFPADAGLRACWVRAIRKDEGPTFTILCGSTYICSQHFTSEEKYVSASGRSKLKKGTVQSRFLWIDWGSVSLMRTTVTT